MFVISVETFNAIPRDRTVNDWVRVHLAVTRILFRLLTLAFKTAQLAKDFFLAPLPAVLEANLTVPVTGLYSAAAQCCGGEYCEDYRSHFVPFPALA